MGRKIRHLAGIAEAQGWVVTSPDFSASHDPEVRVRQLLAQPPLARRLLLCGSSMGGYVTAMACPSLRPAGLFLMAPALYLPGYPGEPAIDSTAAVVVHGWRDQIVPPESAIRFARAHHARLHLLDDDHRLTASLAFIGSAFSDLLTQLG